MVYSFLGYVLERIINVIAFGTWLDNSVLYGPFQPMYGIGVVLSVALWTLLRKTALTPALKVLFLCIGAGLFTWASEMFSGTMYERLYGFMLWDYRLTFDLWCHHPYSCIIPTTLFGFLAAFTAMVVHPDIAKWADRIPLWQGVLLLVLFVFDVYFTYSEAFFEVYL